MTKHPRFTEFLEKSLADPEVREAYIKARIRHALEEAEEVFAHLWADPDWEDQVSLGFAATFSQGMHELRVRLTGEDEDG